MLPSLKQGNESRKHAPFVYISVCWNFYSHCWKIVPSYEKNLHCHEMRETENEIILMFLFSLKLRTKISMSEDILFEMILNVIHKRK